MKQLGEIIVSSLKKIGLEKRYKAEKIFLNWSNIVGNEIASHSNPGKLHYGILLVSVSNSVWIHHLMTLKESIINKINSFVGEKVVKDIKFQAGYLKNYQNHSEIDEEISRPNLDSVVLSKEEFNFVENLSQILTDTEIQKKVKRILCKDMALRHVRRNNSWKKCSECGTLCPQEQEYCQSCIIQKRELVKIKVRQLLQQAPWLTYHECSMYVPCRITDFMTIQNELIDGVRKTLENEQENSMKIAMAAMLIHGIKPEFLTKDIIDNTMDKLRGKKNVFTFRR
ncbi:MAG: hypothetical protein H6Q67_219 [Firmicutes bacterium]|nr:hypothetical protein [Bacillota bacterium]